LRRFAGLANATIRTAGTYLNLHGVEQNCENVVLSIITVSFNDLSRLQETISSLENSDSRVEHVLVVPLKDLKTRDWLGSVLSVSGSKRPVIFDEGLGIYEAMNLGVARASGKYVCFWNSGDKLFDTGNFQELINALDNSSEPWFLCESNLEWASKTDYNSTCMLQFLLGVPKSFISHQAVVINRLILEEIGVFNLKYRVAADTELLMRCNNKFGEPRLFGKVVVDVQTPQYASNNNRRSRYEVFKISLLRLQGNQKLIAFFNLLRREIMDFLQKSSVIR